MQVAPPEAPPTLGSDGPNIAAAPLESCLDLGNVPAPEMETSETPVNSRKGGFTYNREKGRYVQEWESLDDFNAWCRQEEQVFSIELILSRTSRPTGNGPPLFTQKREYRCLRQHTGGVSKYEKKHPDQAQKIESKKTGCRCQIFIKLYPHTGVVLGRYDANHDHEIGLANIAYTRMSHMAREKIKSMLEQKMEHKEIVCK